MSRVSRIVMTTTLAAALTLGLVVSGCPGESGQSEIALGRITGIDTGSSQPPLAGELAPDFYFENPEGQPTSLSQLQGRPVLVNFWATWCGPCRYEMPFLQQIHQERPGDELVLLAVNVGEGSSDVGQFMQSQGFTFTVLLDKQAAVARRYNVTGIPATFFIDKDGVIQYVQVGAFQSQAAIEAILDQLDQ
jgi:thiol-disulfide isomerase/thioredoxin